MAKRKKLIQPCYRPGEEVEHNDGSKLTLVEFIGWQWGWAREAWKARFPDGRTIQISLYHYGKQ